MNHNHYVEEVYTSCDVMRSKYFYLPPVAIIGRTGHANSMNYNELL